MLERKVVNGSDDRAGREGWRSVLNMQDVNRATTQLSRKRQRYPHNRRVRQSPLYRDVRPTILKSLDCLTLCHIERVTIHSVNLGQSFNQIRNVTLVASQPRADRMSVNGNTKG